MTIDELIKYVGDKYERSNAKGQAQGCMAPVFMLYPDLPRYDWPEDETKIGEYMLRLFDKHLDKVAVETIRPGDIVLMKMFFGMYHPGIYIGNDNVIHCTVNTGMEKMRFSRVRVKGVYRCRQVV